MIFLYSLIYNDLLPVFVEYLVICTYNLFVALGTLPRTRCSNAVIRKNKKTDSYVDSPVSM